MDKRFEEVARLLANAERVLVITGAGVSVESGIPTFRGSSAAFPSGLTEEGIPFEEALSGPSFLRYPELSWKYFFQLERSLRGKHPNQAHKAIAGLETPTRRVCVATQNIDGLHQRAGSREVIELHGNLQRLRCTECAYSADKTDFDGLPSLPLCPACGEVLRPDIVLYEERLPDGALDRFADEQARGFDLVFSIGTTSLFSYVVEPLLAAAREGIPTVEINPEETPLSAAVWFRFAEPAGLTLQNLLTAMR
ncbi:MAG TPA: Sir2 family NAD-dependent protein deacetylase [Verrucomicrobiae bacterium]|nr:Sir2 family NAD-dependent protein deacetylase [Verrucomicrobiae bacterium]